MFSIGVGGATSQEIVPRSINLPAWLPDILLTGRVDGKVTTVIEFDASREASSRQANFGFDGPYPGNQLNPSSRKFGSKCLHTQVSGESTFIR